MRRPPATVAAAAFAAGLSAPAFADASVLDLFGYGARGMALAGAAASTAEGHAAVYYNPGALGFERHRSFTLGYQHAVFDLTIDKRAQPAASAPSLNLGFVVPLPLGGFLTDRLTVGAAFVIPFKSILVADVPRPGNPSLVLLENRAQTVSLQLAMGVRLCDAVAIGGGFIALAELGGKIDVAPNETGRIGSTVRDELLADYAPTGGVLLRPGHGVRAALVARGESKASFSLPLDANLGATFPLPIPPLDITGVAQYDPRQVAFEISGRPSLTPESDGSDSKGGPFTISGGATWKQWSRFPRTIVYTAVRSGDPAQPKPDFGDTFVVRTGLEGHFSAAGLGLEPRLGYAFEPSPAPPQTGMRNDLDNDRHILGTGIGISWDVLRLDVAFQWHHLAPRTEHKLAGDPMPAIAPATDAVAPGTIAHAGDIYAWGVEIGVTL